MLEFIYEKAKLHGNDLALILVLIIMHFPQVYFFTMFFFVFANFELLLCKYDIKTISMLTGLEVVIILLVNIPFMKTIILASCLQLIFLIIKFAYDLEGENIKDLKPFNNLILSILLFIYILSFLSVINLNPIFILPLSVYFISCFITNFIYEYEKSTGKDYTNEHFENLLFFNIFVLSLTLTMSALGNLAAPIAIFSYTILQIANSQIIDINLHTAAIILCGTSVFITSYIPITIGLTVLLIDKILLLFFNINLSLRYINLGKTREIETIATSLSSFLKILPTQTNTSLKSTEDKVVEKFPELN